jgi:hypothetical protein
MVFPSRYRRVRPGQSDPQLHLAIQVSVFKTANLRRKGQGLAFLYQMTQVLGQRSRLVVVELRDSRTHTLGRGFGNDVIACHLQDKRASVFHRAL